MVTPMSGSMDIYFYSLMGLLITVVGVVLWSTFKEWYISYKCSLLVDDYVPSVLDDPQLHTPDCPECKRNGKFVILYVDPIRNKGKYRQCICGYVEDLPEDTSN